MGCPAFSRTGPPFEGTFVSTGTLQRTGGSETPAVAAVLVLHVLVESENDALHISSSSLFLAVPRRYIMSMLSVSGVTLSYQK